MPWIDAYDDTRQTGMRKTWSKIRGFFNEKDDTSVQAAGPDTEEGLKQICVLVV